MFAFACLRLLNLDHESLFDIYGVVLNLDAAVQLFPANTTPTNTIPIDNHLERDIRAWIKRDDFVHSGTPFGGSLVHQVHPLQCSLGSKPPTGTLHVFSYTQQYDATAQKLDTTTSSSED